MDQHDERNQIQFSSFANNERDWNGIDLFNCIGIISTPTEHRSNTNGSDRTCSMNSVV